MAGAIDPGLLAGIALLQGALVVLSLLGVVAHAFWLRVAVPRRRRRLATARRALREAVDRGRLEPGDAALLSGLPRRLQVGLFGDLAASLEGRARRQAAALAGEAGLVRAAMARCKARRWWRRLQGARLLAMLGTGEAAMRPLFDDRHPAVRTQAAEWAAFHPTPEVVDRLVALLGDGDHRTRFPAQDSLLRIGPASCAALARLLADDEPAGLDACLEVAAGLPDPTFLARALVLCGHDRPSVRARAARLVSRLGGDEAAARLLGLLDDPDPTVRAAAARGLGRLGHWKAAGALADRLGDDSWPVRQQAALALRAMGGPGQLYLRRATAGEDEVAAAIALHVLDLPESSAQALAS